MSHYPPSEEAVTVCMKMTEMLKDSLMWKVPLPSDVTDISDPDMKEWLFSGYVIQYMYTLHVHVHLTCTFVCKYFVLLFA